MEIEISLDDCWISLKCLHVMCETDMTVRWGDLSTIYNEIQTLTHSFKGINTTDSAEMGEFMRDFIASYSGMNNGMICSAGLRLVLNSRQWYPGASSTNKDILHWRDLQSYAGILVLVPSFWSTVQSPHITLNQTWSRCLILIHSSFQLDFQWPDFPFSIFGHCQQYKELVSPASLFGGTVLLGWADSSQ